MSPPRAATGSVCSSAVVSADAAVAEFEVVYRANVAGVAAFFARRCREPQVVADLTSETFVQRSRRWARSIRSAAAPARGSSGSPGASTRSTASGRRSAARRSSRWRHAASWARRKSRSWRPGSTLSALAASCSPGARGCLRWSRPHWNRSISPSWSRARQRACWAYLQVRCASACSAHEIDFARRRRKSESLR